MVAVDFDGTIMIDGAPNRQLLARLRNMQRQGATIVLWTCRAGQRLHDAVRFCVQHGLKPNYVNCNPPDVIRRLGYDPRKVCADIYIDDKSVN